jgi:SNF2 family DNA or RNA helicase
MAEAQAVDRVHRIGQTREVVVTRYIVSNTIETVCLVRRLSAQILVLMLQVATLLDGDRKLTRTSTSNGFSRIN